MKCIDADKLKKEIERRMTENCELSKKAKCFSYRAVEDNDILAFIDSLQQEQPSLPSDLDEAAEEYANTPFTDDEGKLHENAVNLNLFEAFKAGAEWMAGQGVTTEQIVGRTPLNGPNGITVFLYDFDGFEAGDKVIVQIRKK